MQALVTAGLVNYVSLITGSHFALADLMPTMTAPQGHLRDVAARFRTALGVPIVMAGSVREPGEAAALIENGCADVVALARAWIADPKWLTKVEQNDVSSITPWVSCNQACTFAQRGIGPATCGALVKHPTGRQSWMPSIGGPECWIN